MAKNYLSLEETQAFLLGNEAIARGLMEANLQFCASYPGTPTSEILEIISNIITAHNLPIYAEWSTNEKVALETAIAGSLSGLRSMFACKHVGLNVAADALMTLPYMGTIGGLVLVVGDDPSLHSSQNEQDTRYYGIMASVPVLEPSTGQEAYEMAKNAFEISEKFHLPVILRITTRIAHSRSTISMHELKPTYRTPNFIRNPQYVNLPARARQNHKVLVQKKHEIEKYSNTSEWNKIIGETPKKFGIITCGVSYSYVFEAISLLQLDNVAILKMGFYPVSEELTVKFLENVEQALVIEEVEPFLEKEVRVIAQANGILIPIKGKREGLTPFTEELNLRLVITAIQQWMGINKIVFPDYDHLSDQDNKLIPIRGPVLCAGCPHRATLTIVNKALGRKKNNAIFTNDIGCYSLTALPPNNDADTLLDMGASVSMGAGFAHTGIDNQIIAVIGDSTFWHAGLSALANAVFNNANLTVVIVDNLTTAMTGMQGNPSTGEPAVKTNPTNPLSIEKVTEAMGAKTIVIDPWELESSIKSVKDILSLTGVKVIVSRRECVAEALRRVETLEPYEINDELCVGCAVCVDLLGCPAIAWNKDTRNLDHPHPIIDPSLCASCSVCNQLCPTDAIPGTKLKVPDKRMRS